MNCKKFRDLVPAYLYGEISPEERERLTGHAAGCPACRGLLREMEETVARLAAVPGPKFSPREMSGLRDRVLEAVRTPARSPRPSGFRPLLRPLIIPSALAAAALLLVVLLPSRPTAPVVPSEAAELVAFSEAVEEELQLVAEIWREIEEIESLFITEPDGGSEAGRVRRYGPSRV